MKYNIYRFTTLIGLLILSVSCGSNKKGIIQSKNIEENVNLTKTSKDVTFKTGADNFSSYLPLLKDKKVGIVTNQTGVITINEQTIKVDTMIKHNSVVDFLIEKNISIRKIYAPEHGFRGTADAGELIVDGKDTKTNLPIISLYGNNKKPKPEQLEGIDVMIFDLQDVGAGFIPIFHRYIM